MELIVWRVTPTWAASLAWDHSRSARNTRMRVLKRGIRSPGRSARKVRAKTKAFLGPNLEFSEGKGNRLNGTVCRGDGWQPATLRFPVRFLMPFQLPNAR